MADGPPYPPADNIPHHCHHRRHLHHWQKAWRTSTCVSQGLDLKIRKKVILFHYFVNLRCEISSRNEALQGEDPDAKKGNTLNFRFQRIYWYGWGEGGISTKLELWDQAVDRRIAYICKKKSLLYQFSNKKESPSTFTQRYRAGTCDL